MPLNLGSSVPSSLSSDNFDCHIPPAPLSLFLTILMSTATGSLSLAISFSSPSSPICLRPSLSFRSNDLDLHNFRRNSCRSSPLHLRASSNSDSAAPLEVIGIGSRKDAIIDFCLSNPMISSSRLRFWSVHVRDSQKVQLLQRCHKTEVLFEEMEFPLSLLPCPPAIILVASAGVGIDHIAALELLSTVKSAGGLAVSILLRPFSFEGQRRVQEVDSLANELQKFADLCIVVEADSLLKAEMETLGEALDNMNNVVCLAMHTISVLMSGVHLKILNTSDGHTKEAKSSEVLQLLGTHGEAKAGFGAGLNVESAILQAVYHCPFLCGELKGFRGVVIFTLTSSCDINESDFHSAVLSFRQFTECTGDIVSSRIHEPKMEPNLIVATVLLAGCKERRVPQTNFLSGLALRFPFLSSFFGRNELEPTVNQAAYFQSEPSVGVKFPAETKSTTLDSVNRVPEVKFEERFSRESSHNHKTDSSEASYELVTEDYQSDGGSRIVQLCDEERADLVGSNQIDVQETFSLPIGVQSSSESLSDSVEYSESDLPDTSGKFSMDSHGTATFPSKDEFPDTGVEAISDIYNAALTLLKRRKVDEPRKRGILSERAASMLESERDPPKSWNPVMELQYRGGIYKGRCDGGLPGGKGNLTFPDGSFYDGMWHHGKRSGVGVFCYTNGDVFQGSWRDDLMHGKGWFYFHNGDRWFANFWKGKANGEGRYYSNNGSIFLGCFQNNRRHGRGLCIDIDGSRWTELWEEGTLISRTLLEKGPER